MVEHSEQCDLSDCKPDILDKALKLVPELRIGVEAVQRARNSSLSYPIESVQEVLHLLHEESYRKEGHDITRASLPRFLTPELFPIQDEEDLIGKVYLSLLRCRESSADSCFNCANREMELSDDAKSHRSPDGNKTFSDSVVRVTVEVGGGK